MILGIGHDICDIRRIEAILERQGERFKERIFTPAERVAAEASNRQAAFLALRFATKEAVYKAFGAYDQQGMGWHDAEIASKTDKGAPILTLSGKCKTELERLLPPNYGADIHLSLSDEYPYASAYVILAAKPVIDL